MAGVRHRTARRLAAAAAIGLAWAAPAAHASVWQDAASVADQLGDAQASLILASPRQALRDVADARASYERGLRRAFARGSETSDRRVRSALVAAERAAAAGDEVTLASSIGDVRAAIYQGAFARATTAAESGDADAARSWLLIREFRTATRFTRPGSDATAALRRPVATAKARQAAGLSVRKDLLDAYQGRLRDLLEDVEATVDRGLPVRLAQSGAQAAGYFEILAPRYREDRGVQALASARGAFTELRTATKQTPTDKARVQRARVAAATALGGFTAAPLTPDEATRRAQQLLQFLELVPIEYDRGVSDRKVTTDFEIQEAIAFHAGARAALADLELTLTRVDRVRTQRAVDGLARLGQLVGQAARQPQNVASEDDVQVISDRVNDDLRAVMPSAWTEPSEESEYDLIALTLDRLEASVGAGDYKQAEQTRLEAYGFFEFGPERRLQAFNPGLALDVERLIWFGTSDEPGLARLIADKAPRREIKATRATLDDTLADSAATLGDSASRATVVTNAAIIVFREGLEGVLILAAITASFVGARRRMRRPVFVGAGLGLLASLITWALAQTLLRSLEQYGEKLEAIVGLLAIGVLLLITNWFFHRVYWSEWIAKFHRKRKALEKLDGVGISFLSAQVVGLMLLGLTSVYREGFETVLFLQSLQLSAGTVAVVEGAALGLALTLAVAVVTFFLQRKLPYKRMLVVTGVLIGFVLVVMVGQTARTMQGTGWLSISTLDVAFPFWWGLWFGVYPTVETIGAQVLAAVFVIGSYYLAREIQVKRPQRRAAAKRAAAAATTTGHGSSSGRLPTRSRPEASGALVGTSPGGDDEAR